VWKAIHHILHPNPKPLHKDPEKLNKYFISTATRTLGTEPDNVQDLLNLVQSLPEQTEHSGFTLKNVHQFEIVKEISRLRSDTSTGFDQIPVKFIKLVSTDLIGPLTYIINTCIDSSLFPRTWKTARVSPIPKINNPTCEKDYRPISILPALSKIFERLVNNQIVTYIDEQGLLASGISGYRSGYSTTTVLLRIRDDVIKAMKRGDVTMMVCADYYKAFDTVQFKAVLMKIHGMGFSKKFLRWVLNYLCERQQFVQIDDASSELATVEFGVPQGSILGPILFNLYIADLHEKLKCLCYQYADDTTFYQHTKVADLEHCATQMNNTISRLGQYSNESNLALNGKKTKWLLLSTRQMSRLHRLQDAAVQLTCNGETLERVLSIKLLWTNISLGSNMLRHSSLHVVEFCLC
jgi:hypothetical protein